MNSSNLFVLGLLLLTANLSLGALFAPARAGRTGADRLVLLWKLLFLAAIQIGAWAIVLYQGDASLSLAMAFSRAAACFALIGGSGGGLAGVWGEVAPFIALNGLLYIVVSVLSLLRGNSISPDAGEELPPPTPSEKEQTASAKRQTPSLSIAVGEPVSRQSAEMVAGPALPSAPGASGGVNSAPALNREPELQRGGFRPTIPKAVPINVQLSPEEELAEQMKPVGPTPPPIRFEWRN